MFVKSIKALYVVVKIHWEIDVMQEINKKEKA